MAAMAENHVHAVMATAGDASLCKLSASSLGYYEDAFVSFFVKNPSRRMPLINRGYYARVTAIETLVRKFLQMHQTQQKLKTQVVILGAGHDTLFYRLKKNSELVEQQCEYFELDFQDVTMQKVAAIRRRQQLREVLGINTPADFQAAVKPSYAELHVPGYHLLPCDLRDLKATQEMLVGAGIDQSAPTLFVSECVLIYMEAQYSSQLIQWTSEFFNDVSFVLYEQILPDDAFGRVMMANIKARGCDLLSIHDYPTVETQINRFHVHGFQMVQCWDMNDIYYKYLNEQERLKREKLEIFDELEEFHLLQAHYCVVVASKQTNSVAGLALQLQS